MGDYHYCYMPIFTIIIYYLPPLPPQSSQGHFHNLEEGELNANFAADVAGTRGSVEAR